MKSKRWKLPFYNGPTLIPVDYRKGKTAKGKAAIAEAGRERSAVREKNRKQFIESFSSHTLFAAEDALNKWLTKRGWLVSSSGERKRNGIRLLSDEGFEDDREANVAERAHDAKTNVVAIMAACDASEIERLMWAYDAGIQHAEMIAYREKPGKAGRPPKVTVRDVEAAYQRFRANRKNNSTKETCALLAKAPYWVIKYKLTYQHYRKWRKWRKEKPQ
jgi:hypothetical protein